MVSGIEFIQLNLADGSFARWATGSAAGLRKLKYIEGLKRLRTEKTIALTIPQPDGLALFDDDARPATSYMLRVQRKKAVEAANRGGVDDFVVIDMPGYDHGDVQVQPYIGAKVLPAVDAKVVLSIELTATVLQHLRGALNVTEPIPDHRLYSEAVDGVTWLASRNVWQAHRYEGDEGPERKRVRKQFRPVSTDALDVQTAKDEAIAWQLGVAAAVADSKPLVDANAEAGPKAIEALGAAMLLPNAAGA